MYSSCTFVFSPELETFVLVSERRELARLRSGWLSDQTERERVWDKLGHLWVSVDNDDDEGGCRMVRCHGCK